MTSWRETASQQSQDDFDELVNVGLGAAEQQLREQGEFYPFGAVQPTTGTARLVAVPPTSEEATAEDVLDGVWEALRHERDDVRAVAVVSNREAADTDLVTVELEHVEGHAIEVALPYRLERGELTTRALEAREGVRRVW